MDILSNGELLTNAARGQWRGGPSVTRITLNNTNTLAPAAAPATTTGEREVKCSGASHDPAPAYCDIV